MHGSVTDLNIWDRVLNHKEISDWTSCQTETEGNVLNWETARLNVTELNVSQIERNETCYQKKDSTYLAFHHRLDFDATIRFCQNIGGIMAVLDGAQAYQDIKTAVDEVEPEEGFFTGFTDREKAGEWVSATTGAAWPGEELEDCSEEEECDCSVIWKAGSILSITSWSCNNDKVENCT